MRARLLLAVPLVLALGCSTRGARAPEAPAAPREDLVRFDASPSIFPPTWHRSGVTVRARPLAAARQAEARAWTDAALAKYPSDFLHRHVDGVYVLGGLAFRGVEAGGSNSRRRIYVVMPEGHAARAYFERVVHAEISSILLRRYRSRFDERAWLQGTIPGFRYGASGPAAVRHGVAGRWPTAWTLKQGFLYEYGMSSLENDFNSYAAFAFTHPQRLLSAGAHHPGGVGLKRALTLAFYRSLDPRFAALGSPDLPSVDLTRR